MKKHITVSEKVERNVPEMEQELRLKARDEGPLCTRGEMGSIIERLVMTSIMSTKYVFKVNTLQNKVHKKALSK